MIMETVDPRGVSLLRLRNRQKALIALRDQQGMNRGELGKFLGVTRNTATLIVNELLEEGLVCEDGEKKAIPGAGRPGKALFLQVENLLFGGCILNEDYISVAVGDYNGRILKEDRISIPEVEPEKYLALVASALKELEKKYPQIQRWGIGAPGLIDETEGRIVYTARLGWRDVEVVSLLRGSLEKPCKLVNRIQAASLMSTDFLLSKGYKKALYVHLTTGVGGASLSLLPGQRHYYTEMREIGHFCVVEEGRPCSCGNRGCLEQYAGELAVNEAISFYNQQANSTIGAREKVFGEVGRYVGKALAQAVNLLLPEVILIDGPYVKEKIFQEQVIRICHSFGLAQVMEKIKFCFLENPKSQIFGILMVGIKEFDQEDIFYS